jgi:hypothetical protein
MILKSIEEGISFKIRVFPMAQPLQEDLDQTFNSRDYTPLSEYLEENEATFLFIEILEILEPVSASGPTEDDPDGWEGSPLHNETLETITVGNRAFLFTSGTSWWISTGDYSDDVEIVEEGADHGEN